MRYFGVMDLLGFQNAKVIDYEDQDENVVRGVFIPLEDNDIRYIRKKNHAFVNLDFRERKPNPDDQCNSIKPYVPKKNITAYKEKFGEIPFLGYLKAVTTSVRYIPQSKSLSEILDE